PRSSDEQSSRSSEHALGVLFIEAARAFKYCRPNDRQLSSTCLRTSANSVLLTRLTGRWVYWAPRTRYRQAPEVHLQPVDVNFLPALRLEFMGQVEGHIRVVSYPLRLNIGKELNNGFGQVIGEEADSMRGIRGVVRIVTTNVLIEQVVPELCVPILFQQSSHTFRSIDWPWRIARDRRRFGEKV